MEETIAERLKRLNLTRNSPEYKALKGKWESAKERLGASAGQSLELRNQLVALEDRRELKN